MTSTQPASLWLLWSHPLRRYSSVLTCSLLLLWAAPVSADFSPLDLLMPRAKSWSQWRLRARVGAHYVFQNTDAYSPIGIPMEMRPRLDIFDRTKHIQLIPIMINFNLLENGRNNVFESFSYGLEIGSISYDYFLLPRLHIHYDFGLYRTGLQHHVRGAGLNLRLGVRIPLWFRASLPRLYNQNHLHLFLHPLSVIFLGRLDEATHSDRDPIRPLLNGHAGIQLQMQLLSRLSLLSNFLVHWNYTNQRSLLLQARAGLQVRLTSLLSLRLDATAQLPAIPALRRSNLYNLYFMRFFSAGVELWLDIRLPALRKGGRT